MARRPGGRIRRDAGLPRYKLPDQMLVVPSWPLTTLGKINKEQLVTLAQNTPQTTPSTAPAAAPSARPAYHEEQANIDAIRRFKPGRRGWYSGCVLLVDGDGSLDAALVLRSAYQRDGRIWLQAGAGIVAQSNPDRELEETIEKLTCIVKAVVLRPQAVEATHGGA